MPVRRFSPIPGAIAAALLIPAAHGLVTTDELTLLQDADGWEYTKIATGNGFPTEHVCFDGSPHPNECRGTLTLGADERFVKKIFIQGQSDTRTGRYKIDSGDITFFDEYDVQDGPYGMKIDDHEKTLALVLGNEHIDLMLEKEYRSRNKPGSKNTPPQQ